MKVGFEVTGVRPEGKISLPKSAFKNVDLPLENCPTIATVSGPDKNRSSLFSSCFSSALG